MNKDKILSVNLGGNSSFIDSIVHLVSYPLFVYKNTLVPMSLEGAQIPAKYARIGRKKPTKRYLLQDLGGPYAHLCDEHPSAVSS